MELDAVDGGATSNGGSRAGLELDLSHNNLLGPLPSPLGLAPLAWTLTSLSLVGNGLRGPLPPALGCLARLRDLSLGHNRFSGPVDRGLFRRLGLLRTLSLRQNRLSGRAPQLSTLARLELLGGGCSLYPPPPPPPRELFVAGLVA